jgi:hypothetical protein
MDEHEIIKSEIYEMMNVQYLPSIKHIDLDLANTEKYPITNVSALGVAFQPLVSAIQTITGANVGKSGLYWVNTGGKEMFRSTGGFIGGLKAPTGAVGGGQARLNPFLCDPVMLLTSIALMNIEKKLGEIQELQHNIIDYLKTQEKAKILGNINVLNDVLENYKFNWDNEKYKANKHILVQDIRKESEQSLLLSRNQIERQFAKKDLFHSDEKINSIIKNLQDEFRGYQQALYLYSFSAFLEVMLLENFDSKYLKSVANRMREYTANYQELYTSCYNQIEGFSNVSIQSFLTKGLSEVSKGVGGVIAKIPSMRKRSIDVKFVSAGERLDKIKDDKVQRTVDTFASSVSGFSLPFIENIEVVNKVFNEPKEILFDAENIYFLT